MRNARWPAGLQRCADACAVTRFTRHSPVREADPKTTKVLHGLLAQVTGELVDFWGHLQVSGIEFMMPTLWSDENHLRLSALRV